LFVHIGCCFHILVLSMDEVSVVGEMGLDD